MQQRQSATASSSTSSSFFRANRPGNINIINLSDDGNNNNNANTVVYNSPNGIRSSSSHLVNQPIVQSPHHLSIVTSEGSSSAQTNSNTTSYLNQPSKTSYASYNSINITNKINYQQSPSTNQSSSANAYTMNTTLVPTTPNHHQTSYAANNSNTNVSLNSPHLINQQTQNLNSPRLIANSSSNNNQQLSRYIQQQPQNSTSSSSASLMNVNNNNGNNNHPYSPSYNTNTSNTNGGMTSTSTQVLQSTQSQSQYANTYEDPSSTYTPKYSPILSSAHQFNNNHKQVQYFNFDTAAVDNLNCQQETQSTYNSNVTYSTNTNSNANDVTSLNMMNQQSSSLGNDLCNTDVNNQQQQQQQQQQDNLLIADDTSNTATLGQSSSRSFMQLPQPLNLNAISHRQQNNYGSNGGGRFQQNYQNMPASATPFYNHHHHHAYHPYQQHHQQFNNNNNLTNIGLKNQLLQQQNQQQQLSTTAPQDQHNFQHSLSVPSSPINLNTFNYGHQINQNQQSLFFKLNSINNKTTGNGSEQQQPSLASSTVASSSTAFDFEANMSTGNDNQCKINAESDSTGVISQSSTNNAVLNDTTNTNEPSLVTSDTVYGENDVEMVQELINDMLLKEGNNKKNDENDNDNQLIKASPLQLVETDNKNNTQIIESLSNEDMMMHQSNQEKLIANGVHDTNSLIINCSSDKILNETSLINENGESFLKDEILLNNSKNLLEADGREDHDVEVNELNQNDLLKATNLKTNSNLIQSNSSIISPLTTNLIVNDEIDGNHRHHNQINGHNLMLNNNQGSKTFEQDKFQKEMINIKSELNYNDDLNTTNQSDDEEDSGRNRTPSPINSTKNPHNTFSKMQFLPSSGEMTKLDKMQVKHSTPSNTSVAKKSSNNNGNVVKKLQINKFNNNMETSDIHQKYLNYGETDHSNMNNKYNLSNDVNFKFNPVDPHQTFQSHLIPPSAAIGAQPPLSASSSSIQYCSDCNKIFTNKSALAKHRLIHSNERKYSCNLCDKSFKRQDHLNGHLLTHQDKKPFECKAPNCDKSYCDSRSLKRHVESQHQDYLASLANGNHEALNYLPSIGKIKANLAPNVEHVIIVNPVGDDNSYQTGTTSNSNLIENCNSNSIGEPRSPINNQQNSYGFNNENVAQQSNTKAIKNFFTFEEPKPEKCKICGKGFKNVPALNGHMRLHGGFIKTKYIPKSGSKDMNNNEFSLNNDDSMSSNCSSSNNSSFSSSFNSSSNAGGNSLSLVNNNNNNNFKSNKSSFNEHENQANKFSQGNNMMSNKNVASIKHSSSSTSLANKVPTNDFIIPSTSINTNNSAHLSNNFLFGNSSNKISYNNSQLPQQQQQKSMHSSKRQDSSSQINSVNNSQSFQFKKEFSHLDNANNSQLLHDEDQYNAAAAVAAVTSHLVNPLANDYNSISSSTSRHLTNHQIYSNHSTTQLVDKNRLFNQSQQNKTSANILNQLSSSLLLSSANEGLNYNTVHASHSSSSSYENSYQSSSLNNTEKKSLKTNGKNMSSIESPDQEFDSLNESINYNSNTKFISNMLLNSNHINNAINPPPPPPPLPNSLSQTSSSSHHFSSMNNNNTNSSYLSNNIFNPLKHQQNPKNLDLNSNNGGMFSNHLSNTNFNSNNNSNHRQIIDPSSSASLTQQHSSAPSMIQHGLNAPNNLNLLYNESNVKSNSKNEEQASHHFHLQGNHDANGIKSSESNSCKKQHQQFNHHNNALNESSHSNEKKHHVQIHQQHQSLANENENGLSGSVANLENILKRYQNMLPNNSTNAEPDKKEQPRLSANISSNPLKSNLPPHTNHSNSPGSASKNESSAKTNGQLVSNLSNVNKPTKMKPIPLVIPSDISAFRQEQQQKLQQQQQLHNHNHGYNHSISVIHPPGHQPPQPPFFHHQMSSSSVYPNATLLKSPRLHINVNYDIKKQYTPPPMLSPFRKGPGLFYKYIANLLQTPAFLQQQQHQQQNMAQNLPYNQHHQMYQRNSHLNNNNMLTNINQMTSSAYMYPPANTTQLFYDLLTNTFNNMNSNANSNCDSESNSQINLAKQHEKECHKRSETGLEDIERSAKADEINKINKNISDSTNERKTVEFDKVEVKENEKDESVKRKEHQDEQSDEKSSTAKAKKTEESSNMPVIHSAFTPKPGLMRQRLLSQISVNSSQNHNSNNCGSFFPEEMFANETIAAALIEPSDIKPFVNLGEEFQAELPTFRKFDIKSEEDLAYSNKKMEDLMWSSEILEENSKDRSNYENYFDLICNNSLIYGSSNNLELGLHILQFFEGNLKLSIKAFFDNSIIGLPSNHPIATYKYTETDIWTQDEIKKFEESIIKNDKMFSEISKDLSGSKSIKQCIEFYYLWKKVMNDQIKKKWKTLKKNRLYFDSNAAVVATRSTIADVISSKQEEIDRESKGKKQATNYDEENQENNSTTTTTNENKNNNKRKLELEDNEADQAFKNEINRCVKCDLVFKSSKKLKIHINKKH